VSPRIERGEIDVTTEADLQRNQESLYCSASMHVGGDGRSHSTGGRTYLTRRWCLRPVIFLPAWKLCGSSAERPWCSGCHDRRTSARFASGLFERRYAEHMVNAHQLVPQQEVVVRGSAVCGRASAMPTTNSQSTVTSQITFSLADIHVPRPAAALGRKNHRLSQHPPGVAKVTRMTKAVMARPRGDRVFTSSALRESKRQSRAQCLSRSTLRVSGRTLQCRHSS